ncbi:MAG: permease [Oscillospiraceae bacterium]|nr:permease [Oscillospiraceae bacterium]
MEFVSKLIGLGQTPVVLLSVFLVCFIGYLLGSVKVKGLCLGTAGVFLFALLFGYLCTIPALQDVPVLKNFFMANAHDSKISSFKFISNIGLVLFVTSVGSIAGPKFFRDLKANAKSYVPMGALIILMGAVVTVAFALIPGIGSAYATGILSGALTSTPAFSAAQGAVEAMAPDQLGLVSLGHAVAYPFGVIGVVLFVQIMPRILKADMAKERTLIGNAAAAAAAEKKEKKRFELDEFGFGAFGLAVVLGILLGSIKIPLSGEGFDGPCFSLGLTGGPLLMSLILAHFGHIGPVSLKIDEHALKSFREFGLMLFLVGAGVEGGVELVEQIAASEYGIMLVVYGFVAGAIMTIIPMVVGYLFARKICKLPLLNNLGSITGGMTSTPALGTLIGVAGTDDVAGAYASTYPIALVLVVLASQLINSFMLV